MRPARGGVRVRRTLRRRVPLSRPDREQLVHVHDVVDVVHVGDLHDDDHYHERARCVREQRDRGHRAV
jgi:hypothetical protein